MMVEVADGSLCEKKQPSEIIREYCLFETDTNLGGLYIEKLKKSSRRTEAEMKTDSIFMSEVNADLWDRALATAIGDINNTFYPHLSVVQELIKYTLNSHMIDIGKTKCFFNKLVIFHPPNSVDIKKYYLCFLNDKYLTLNSVKDEEEIAFWHLIDVLCECLADVKVSMEKSSEVDFINKKTEKIENLYKKPLRSDGEWVLSAGKKEKVWFEGLPPSDKVQRVLLVLEFLSAVLEADFTERMKESNFVSSNDCLLFGLLWDNHENVGLMNEKVKKIVHMWFVMEKGKFCNFSSVHRNLLTLVSEVIRCSDDVEGFYPYLGHKSHSFADEVVTQIGDCLKESIKTVKTVRIMKPHWLRMLVCAGLLSRITGKSYPPELATAHGVLECVAKILGKNDYECENKRVRSWRISGDVKSCVCRLVKAKRAKLSVQVDVDSTNDRGWTVLHEAVLNGHEKCVEKLMKNDQRNPIDGRRKGVNGFTPLMCAVVTNHAGISRRLLEHFGGELLTDVDDSGRTPLDLCRSKDVYDAMVTFESGISIVRNELESCVDLSVQLVFSYFITHRTLDLWKCRNRMRKAQTKSGIRWDRARYETDVQINIDKLTGIVTKIVGIEELTLFVEPLRRVLSFKNCPY